MKLQVLQPELSPFAKLYVEAQLPPPQLENSDHQT